MSKELNKKSEELEQTLAKQLELLKKDSENWVKIGGLVLAGGLLTFALVKKSTKKRKDRTTEKAMMVLEREGLLSKEIEDKLSHSSKSSFWPSMGQRLLLVGLALAKDKVVPLLLNQLNINGRPEARR